MTPRLFRTRGGTEVVEQPPRECPNGHKLGKGKYQASWDPSDAGGRKYRCNECGVTWLDR